MTIRDNNNTYAYDWAGRLMERSTWKPREEYPQPELVATTRYVYQGLNLVTELDERNNCIVKFIRLV